MVLPTSRHLTPTCPCKQTFHARHPRPHRSAKSKQKNSADPLKFYQTPLVFLKCVFDSLFNSREKQAIADMKSFVETGRGYAAEQSTKPQTLGYSLADSPVGMLAWIYEKLVSWSDSYPWEDDEGMVA